jgi:hypothetical protein
VETGYPQGMILPTPPGITPTTAEQDQQHYDDDDEGRGAHERFLQCSGMSVGRSATKGYSNDTLNQPPILSHVRLMDFRIRDGTSALSGKAPGRSAVTVTEDQHPHEAQSLRQALQGRPPCGLRLISLDLHRNERCCGGHLAVSPGQTDLDVDLLDSGPLSPHNPGPVPTPPHG